MKPLIWHVNSASLWLNTELACLDEKRWCNRLQLMQCFHIYHVWIGAFFFFFFLHFQSVLTESWLMICSCRTIFRAHAVQSTRIGFPLNILNTLYTTWLLKSPFWLVRKWWLIFWISTKVYINALVLICLHFYSNGIVSSPESWTLQIYIKSTFLGCDLSIEICLEGTNI